MHEHKRAMPNLIVRLFGTLPKTIKDYDADTGISVIVPEGSTVADLIQILDLETRQVGMVFLNGVLVAPDRELEDGAELKLFQPIAGG